MSREESDEKKLLDQSREYVQKQVAVGGPRRRSRWKRKFGSELGMLIRWMQSKSSNSLTEPPRITGEGISAGSYYSTSLHQAEGQSRNAVLAYTTAGE